MKWEKVRLGKFITPKKGFAFKSSKYVASGVPIVRVSNFTNDSISNDDLKYYPLEEKVNFGEFELCEKDVIIQTVGSWQNNPASVVGKVVRVPYYLDGALLNQNAVKLIPKNSIDNNYLFYRLKTDAFKGHVLGEARGAANQASITLDTIKSFEFLIPDKKKQIKIGNILSTYDELIENNQKQVKLLEEAAQRLYKEWFVDLRFPGYENTPIIDGVPEGWKKGILGDIAINVGKKVKKEDRNKYKQYLPIDCLPRKSLAYTESLNIKLAESSLVSFKPKDILFGAMRPYFHKVVIAYDKGLTRNTCFVINAKEREFLSYLTMLLFSDNTINYATTISVGTTMPYVRLNDFLNMEIIIPAPHIVKEFEKLFKPISEDIVNFAKQIGVLSEVRDRLLTKLMSGEIEV